jgi:hypothetical protein
MTGLLANRARAPIPDTMFGIGKASYWSVYGIAAVVTAVVTAGFGAGGDGEAGANIVYRVLRSDENPALGLFPKNAAATYTPEGHILNGSRPGWASQFISTTRDLSVAQSWAARSGGRIVGIDLSAVSGRVLDLSSGAGLRGITAQNFARASAEVLIEGHIPAGAIEAVLWPW